MAKQTTEFVVGFCFVALASFRAQREKTNSEFLKLGDGMPVRSEILLPMPSETARAARATYEPSSLLLLVGEHLDAILANVDFQCLDRADARVTFSPALIAVMTILQFIEDLADREVAYAVRTRTDWKFAFHLPLDHLGVDERALCDFRERVLRDPNALAVFDLVLHRFARWSARMESQRDGANDALSVIRAVQVRNRLDRVGAAMRDALEALTAYWHEWLREIALPHWYDRYTIQSPSFRLPRAAASRVAMLVAIEEDGRYLLHATRQANAPPLAATLIEIRQLDRVWRTEFASARDALRSLGSE